MLSLAGLGLALPCCAVRTSAPPSVSRESLPMKQVEPAITEERPSPRVLASLHLTDQARKLLEIGKADEAIRTLEHAVNLNPTNGLNYFYLSEAWLLKRNLAQAEEFNRLAVLYLKGDSTWMSRLREQGERIKKLGR